MIDSIEVVGLVHSISPDLTTVLGVHGRPEGTLERLSKRGQINQRALINHENNE